MMWNVLRKRRGERPKARGRVRLLIESLEERALLSTFTVVNLNDAGAGTGLTGDLRYCIVTANANGDLYRVDDLCREIHAQRRMSWIPSDYPNLYSSDVFLPAEMAALYEAGRSFGKTNDAWYTTILQP